MECSYCAFLCYDNVTLMKHMKSFHGHDPRFCVSCRFCGQEYKKWDSLKKHLRRSHKTEMMSVRSTVAIESLDNENSEEETDSLQIDHDDSGVSMDTNNPIVTSHPEYNSKMAGALHLMQCTHAMSLNHSGVDELCLSSQALVQEVSRRIDVRLRETLANHSITISPTLHQDISEACNPRSLFDGLHSRYNRERFYKEAFNYVNPSSVLMGQRWEWRTVNDTKKLVEVKHYGATVDLIGSLKALLSNDLIKQEIMKPHSRTDSIMEDYCDGKFFKEHAVFRAHPNALQFILYYDDIEVANPLGSRSGVHKIGCFYYILGNIRPVFRSSISAIQVIALARTSDIKDYGCESLLGPFINDIEKLSSESGYNIELHDSTNMTIHGAILCLLGDVPASNFMGGFKEGVGFALRKCRACMATQEKIQTKFHVSEYIIRNIKDHMDYIKLIESDTSSTRTHSTTYGINGRSLLMKLQGFDVTKCLPFDVMHTVFEGVANFHLMHLLSYLIDEKNYFTLEQLNNAMQSHDYGYSEKDTKPSPIQVKQNVYTIKQSASQMMTLIRLLPFMIGHFIEKEDQHWECFLLLSTIASSVCAFSVTMDDAIYLAWIIEAYLELFHSLYPAVMMTPKMHYLIHLPDQIVMFGPLRQQWCMRFESKNAQMKSFISKCFKNVPLTVATHHQHWLCYHLFSNPNSDFTPFLYEGDQISSGIYYNLENYKDAITELCGFVEGPLLGNRLKSVTIYGTKYTSGCVIRLRQPDGFSYAQVNSIILFENHKLFEVTTLRVTEYDTHCQAYQIERTNSESLCLYSHFHCHGVLHLKEKGGNHYVIEKDDRGSL